nr:hypothetical protein [Tanacetum cinerariifolium]
MAWCGVGSGKDEGGYDGCRWWSFDVGDGCDGVVSAV